MSQSENKKVGGYEISRKLGQGAMGAVFLARQISTNRLVALKVLPPRLAQNKTFVERFLREARAAARLSHPNIVQAYDAGFADGYFYFAMEYVNGSTLQAVLNKRGALQEHEALKIAANIADALQHAHLANLIHRDVKPDNILIAADGTPKLADLGVAREITETDSQLTQSGAAVGTPFYISPEQVRGERDIDGRADIYSLGATLYHLLTGFPPYKGGTSAEIMAKHLVSPPPDPRRDNPNVSPAAAAIVMRAMAKDRLARYQTASGMATVIDIGPTKQLEPVAVPVIPVEKPTKTVVNEPRQYPVMPIVSAVIVLALVILFFFMISGPQKPAIKPTATEPKSPAVAVIEKLTAADEAARQVEASAVQEPKRPIVQQPLINVQEEQRRQAGERLFQDMTAQAAGLAEQKDFDGAAALFKTVPPQYLDLLGVRANASARKMILRGESEVTAIISRSQVLAGQGKLDTALDTLREADLIKCSTMTGKTEAFRKTISEQLQKQRDEEVRRAEQATADARKALLEKNISMAKHYADNNSNIKKDDLKNLESQFGDEWSSINTELNNLQKEYDAAEIGRRQAQIAMNVSSQARTSYYELGSAMSRIQSEMGSLRRSRDKLASTIARQKAAITSRYTTRQSQIQSTYDNLKSAISSGRIDDEDEMTRSYEKIFAVPGFGREPVGSPAFGPDGTAPDPTGAFKPTRLQIERGKQ